MGLDSDHPLRVIFPFGVGEHHVLNLVAPSVAQQRLGLHVLAERDRLAAAEARGELQAGDTTAWEAMYASAEDYVRGLIISIEVDGKRVPSWADDLDESGLIAGNLATAIVEKLLFRGRDRVQVLGVGGAQPNGGGPANPA